MHFEVMQGNLELTSHASLVLVGKARGLSLDFVVLWIGGGGVALGVCGLGRST